MTERIRQRLSQRVLRECHDIVRTIFIHVPAAIRRFSTDVVVAGIFVPISTGSRSTSVLCDDKVIYTAF